MHGLGEGMSHQVNVLISKLGVLQKVTQMTISCRESLKKALV